MTRGPLGAVVALIALTTTVRAEPAVLCADRLPIEVGSAIFEVPYCATVDLLGPQTDHRRAVIVLHGTDRNATDYYDRVLAAADDAGDGGATLVVAPQFVTVEELDFHAMSARTLYWDDGWREGDPSEDTPEHPRAARISSFAVVEEFVHALVRVAPQLQTVVVAGHSAGGQFVQRFAAGNAIDDELTHLDFRYLVANPSSYMYLGPERRVPGTSATFEVPSGIDCPTWYHDYKYGLLELNPYMDAVGADALVQRYLQRRVTVLLGEDDDDPFSATLDTSCAAMLQGAHRLERGIVFQRHLADRFGSAASHHVTAIVPGVGHSSSRMFRSDCALLTLFGKREFEAGCQSSIDLVPIATAAPRTSRSIAFEDARPNPFNPRTEIRFRTQGTEPVSVTIHSVDGRRVFHTEVEPDGSGSAVFAWNGTDSSGRPVASGIYRVEGRQAGERATGSVVLLR